MEDKITDASKEYVLKDKDYFSLWQYFSEDTAKVKDKLWTIASWLYVLMSGLLGFIAKHQIELENQAEIAIGKHLSFWSIAMVFVGFALSFYTVYMVREYGRHIKGGWRITNFLIDKIEGLEEVWESRKEANGGKKPHDFVKRLEIFAWGYGIVFLSVLIYMHIKII